jgi:hypothetical protein
MKSKSKQPGLSESFPYVLPCHEWDYERWHKAVDCERVGAIGNKVIYRRLSARPIKISEAEAAVEADYTSWRWLSPEGLKPAFQDGGDNIKTLRRTADEVISHLNHKAWSGDGVALAHLAAIARSACEALSQIVRTNPKALAPIARKHGTWPMMRSTHPLNCDPDEWLNAMELGADIPINLDQCSKWKPQGMATQCAFSLYQHLESIRQNDEIEAINGRARGEWLPPFSRDTAGQWWDVAWAFLLKTYPQPEQVAELNQIVKGPRKRRSPGRLRDAIKRTIQQRFTAMAKVL